MLDQTLATYITNIEQHCDSPDEIADAVCELYERLLNLERTKKETTKLLPIKRRAETFMTEVLSIARTRTEYRIGKNRKKFDEAYWIGFYGQLIGNDLSKYSSRDTSFIQDIEQNIKVSSLKSKCTMYWIINTFDAEWMTAFKHWTDKERIFTCDVNHDLIIRDLRMSEHIWLSFWFNIKFDSEFFDRYIKQQKETNGIEIKPETQEQINYIKQLRP